MLTSTRLLALMLCVLVGVCAYQRVAGQEEGGDMQSLIKSYKQLAQAASKDRSLINPFKFIIRIISFVTFPARFLLRFVTTMISVLVLSIAGCQVIPDVDCLAVNVHEQIEEFISNLREEFDFYLGMANIQDSQ